MISIVGGKGGCGKSTTALGLARAFASAGERPLVVDADCDMPNLHTMAETDRTPGAAALADGARLDRVVHRSQAVPGVDVLPAGEASERLAERTLRRLGQVRGRVLVDCPAGATEAVAGPLRHADAALVVSTADRASQADAVKTARMAEALDVWVTGAVLTRTTREAGTTRGDDPLRRKCAILAEVPEIAGAAGSVLTDPVGRSAYERLAERLRERNI